MKIDSVKDSNSTYIFVSFLLLFFLNSGFSRTIDNILLVFLCFTIFLTQLKYNRQQLIVIVVTITVSILMYALKLWTSISFILSMWINVIALSFVIKRDEINISKSAALLFLFFTMFILTIQLALNFKGKRFVLNYGDPNFSGGIVLLFFYIANKFKSLPSILFAIFVSLLLLSRNLIFSIVLFYLISFFTTRIRLTIPSFLSFFNLTIISTVASIGISFLFLANVLEFKDAGGANRIITIADSGNFQRFSTNIALIMYWFQNPSHFFWGLSDFKDIIKEFNRVTVHNSYLSLIAKYGIFFFISYTIFISSSIGKNRIIDNLPYVLSYLFFMAFLHDFYFGIFFIVFIIIIHIRGNNETISSNLSLSR